MRGFDIGEDNFKWWNTPPPDPLEMARKRGYAHQARVTKGVLFLTSLMPLGTHAGKAMDRVPRDYFFWVNAQPWAARWRDWEPVRDCLDRFPQLIAGAALPHEPVILVDALVDCERTERWKWSKHAHLRCVAGHEDKLDAFALGALHLRPAWKRGEHYDLNEAKHALALQCGAVLHNESQENPRRPRNARRNENDQTQQPHRA